MAKVHIRDLNVRTIIGINDWERKNRQEILINVTFDYDCPKATRKDDIQDVVDYKSLTKKIIREVEDSQFFLLERLTDFVLKLVMKDKRIKEATVRIDKPHALRFARSVSVELSQKRR